MKITPKIKIYLSILFSLVLDLILIFLIILPLWKGITKSSKELVLARGKSILLESQLKNIGELRAVEKKIEPTIEKIENSFVSLETPVEFISFLENLSQSCQVDLKISPPFFDKTKNEAWPFLRLQLTLAGSFPNISRFLGKLEVAPYLIKIETFNIAKLSEKELSLKELERFSPGDVKANFILKVYGK